MRKGTTCAAALMLSTILLPTPHAAFALGLRGGGSGSAAAHLGTFVRVGTLDVSATRVRVTTCIGRPHGFPPYRSGQGKEFLTVFWTLRNPTARTVVLPHADHPGFRLVTRGRLQSGSYLSYPAYSSQVPPHGRAVIRWTLVIPRGTSHVDLTYVPPGPPQLLWSTAIPRVASSGCRIGFSAVGGGL